MEFKLDKMKFSMKKNNQTIKDTETHVKKFQPFQMATFVFDALFNTSDSQRV